MAYFDAASAEPLHPSGRDALLSALADGWADPARLHREGRRAQLHSRMVRRAERAERRQLSHRDLAVQLRARLNELESAG